MVVVVVVVVLGVNPKTRELDVTKGALLQAADGLIFEEEEDRRRFRVSCSR